MTKPEKKEEEKPRYSGMNIYQRLHGAMADVDYVQKSKPKAGGLQYSSVKHDDVTRVTREHLHNWGIYPHLVAMNRTRDGNMTEIDGMYRFLNIDDPKDYVDIPSAGYGVDNQDKGVGKAISYLVKYALLKGLHLETGDDPENDAIEHVPKNAKTDKDVAMGQALGGSSRKDVDPETRDTMFDQALTLLNNVADEKKLKEIWTSQYKGRTVYTEAQWHDIELAKDRAKEEIEQGVR